MQFRVVCRPIALPSIDLIPIHRAWQERQAALLGASLHALIWNYASQFDDPEQSPAAGMEALVDVRTAER